jgi:hypothetical protein
MKVIKGASILGSSITTWFYTEMNVCIEAKELVVTDFVVGEIIYCVLTI